MSERIVETKDGITVATNRYNQGDQVRTTRELHDIPIGTLAKIQALPLMVATESYTLSIPGVAPHITYQQSWPLDALEAV